MNLYKITADYRPKNPNKPEYYVWGENTKEAKKRFNDRINWLKIYGCEKVNDDKVDGIAEMGRVGRRIVF